MRARFAQLLALHLRVDAVELKLNTILVDLDVGDIPNNPATVACAL